MAEKEKLVMVKLSLIDQSAFCAFDKQLFILFPVDGENREPLTLN